MKRTYDVLATGREGRGSKFFYIDGQRVSYAHYCELRAAALARGRIECMKTETKNGRVRHYSVYVITH